MSVIYHPGKANMVMDSLSGMTMGRVFYVEEGKKDLMNDILRFGRLVIWLEDSSNGGFMIHHNYEPSLVVLVMSKKHINQSLMELEESILGTLMSNYP